VKFLFDHDVPDDLSHVLRQMGHTVERLRDVLPTTAPDSAVLAHAATHDLVLVTCNRNDFVTLAQTQAHRGLIVLFRRKSRAAERAALVRLLTTAGETGIVGNVTFA
jgi:predicted nuclease of predicted toxin-antitoxin system